MTVNQSNCVPCAPRPSQQVARASRRRVFPALSRTSSPSPWSGTSTMLCRVLRSTVSSQCLLAAAALFASPHPPPPRDPLGVLSVTRRSASLCRDGGLRGLSGRRGAHARQTASVDGPSILPSPRRSINIPFFGPRGRSERDPLIGSGKKGRLGCPPPPSPGPEAPLAERPSDKAEPEGQS